MSAPRAGRARDAAPRAPRGRTGSRGVASSTDSNADVAPLLLDSHVWVWLLAGRADVMSQQAMDTIERAASSGNCHVSDISAWEVADAASRQLLTLSMEVGAWLDQASHAPGIAALPVTQDLFIASARVPAHMLPHHADRVIVATARKFGLTIVTCDAELIAFARSWPGLGVFDARAAQ